MSATLRSVGLCAIFVGLAALAILELGGTPALAAPPGTDAQAGVKPGDLSLPATLTTKLQQRKATTAGRNPASEANVADAAPANRPPLTDAALGEMLNNMGLEVTGETMSDGSTLYSFTSKYQTWTVPIKVQLGG